MLTKTNEIKDFLTTISEELIEIDSLLQLRYSSLVELRKAAQQPIGRLRLIVIQDLPQTSEGDIQSQLLRILKGASRAGIAILFLSSKNTTTHSGLLKSVENLSGVSVFRFSGNQWYSQEPGQEKFLYDFPVKSGPIISKELSELIDAAKQSSVITIPSLS